MGHLTTKPTKWLHPAKTQISLGIRLVWSESSLCTQWVSKDPSFLHVDSKDWSDWVNAQADLSSLGAHAILFVLSRGGSYIYICQAGCFCKHFPCVISAFDITDFERSKTGKRRKLLTHFIQDTTRGIPLFFIPNTPAVIVFTFHFYFHFRVSGVACVGPTSRESPKRVHVHAIFTLSMSGWLVFLIKKREKESFLLLFLAKWRSDDRDIASDLSDISDRRDISDKQLENF